MKPEFLDFMMKQISRRWQNVEGEASGVTDKDKHLNYTTKILKEGPINLSEEHKRTQ